MLVMNLCKKETPHEHERSPEPKTKIYETFYERRKFSVENYGCTSFRAAKVQHFFIQKLTFLTFFFILLKIM